MIDQIDSMPLLVTACPSFEAAWSEHQAEYGSEVLYVAAGAFAHHLLELHNSNATSTFPAVATAIERLHVEGTPWVREFATVGVLEAVQNVWVNSGTDPEEFGRHLGPASRHWWEGLNNFWRGEVPNVRTEG
jgi:hypothetical protein